MGNLITLFPNVLMIMPSPLPLKPYMFDGFYRWCLETNQTIYLNFHVTPECSVPQQFQNQPNLVLNISPDAVRNFQLTYDSLSFSAKFGGHFYDIFVPIACWISLQGIETGQEHHFNYHDPGQALGSATMPMVSPGSSSGPSNVSSQGLHLVFSTTNVAARRIGPSTTASLLKPPRPALKLVYSSDHAKNDDPDPSSS